MGISRNIYYSFGCLVRWGNAPFDVRNESLSLMTKVQKITVTEDEDGIRLDRWFKRHFPLVGHGQIEKLLRTGQVRLDGGRVKSAARLEKGQTVRVPPLGPSGLERANKSPLATLSAGDIASVQSMVLYRDEDIIVINKPPGLAVQGGNKVSRHLDGLLEGLTFDKTERPRLVHRLDKDTSGIMLLGRNAFAASKLTSAFRNRNIAKVYWALVVGIPNPKAGHINAPIIKQEIAGHQRMVVTSHNAPAAISDFVTVETAGRRVAWLALRPQTGRTHQLRVHCNVLGTPILGDGKYGGKEAFIEGLPAPIKLHLHARSLEFEHPRGGRMKHEAPMSKNMKKTWQFFGFDPKKKIDVFSHLEIRVKQ